MTQGLKNNSYSTEHNEATRLISYVSRLWRTSANQWKLLNAISLQIRPGLPSAKYPRRQVENQLEQMFTTMTSLQMMAVLTVQTCSPKKLNTFNKMVSRTLIWATWCHLLGSTFWGDIRHPTTGTHLFKKRLLPFHSCFSIFGHSKMNRLNYLRRLQCLVKVTLVQHALLT